MKIIFLYADENFPFSVVEGLRALGHDVLTLQDDGRGNQRYPDDAVLARAHKLGRVLLTTNRRHFIRLHQESNAHAGIIVCTYDPNPDGQVMRIDEVLQSTEILDGKLFRVNRPQG